MDIHIDVQAMKRYVLENKKKCLKIAGLVVVLTISLITYVTGNLTNDDGIAVMEVQDNEIVADESNVVAEVQQEQEAYIVVDIEGAVRSPGVVFLLSGSRVNDAVEEAGGLTSDADTRSVNLASRLSDGDKVYIPTHGEQQTSSGSNSQPAGIVTDIVSSGSQATPDGASENSGMVNINTATSAQLQTLRGVGPATAQRIIEHRETVGRFTRIEDIMRVSGIGTRTFEGFRDNIVI
ncbi:MAG: helix-hairpin-helix domain-containing protein [Clostridiales bacterium]|nr:helix-hairpin-helix domain-containing protein [Clostridiales bacterium]